MAASQGEIRRPVQVRSGSGPPPVPRFVGVGLVDLTTENRTSKVLVLFAQEAPNSLMNHWTSLGGTRFPAVEFMSRTPRSERPLAGIPAWSHR